jgi:hypothetical protein
MIGLVADIIQNRGQGNGFPADLFHVLFYNIGRGIGRVVDYHHNAVYKLRHGFNDVADLVFFVVGGNDDGYGFVFEQKVYVSGLTFDV